jgi:hypothetical protein
MHFYFLFGSATDRGDRPSSDAPPRATIPFDHARLPSRSAAATYSVFSLGGKHRDNMSTHRHFVQMLDRGHGATAAAFGQGGGFKLSKAWLTQLTPDPAP